MHLPSIVNYTRNPLYFDIIVKSQTRPCVASNAEKEERRRKDFAKRAGLRAMRKKKLLKAVLILAVILLALLIPASRAGSTQTVPSKETPAASEEGEDAEHTPPVESEASLITKTIAILETSGTLDCSQKGLSGERGCHQYLPGTWRSYSLEVYGYVAEQTPAAAEHVTLTKVQRWLDAGYTPRQIFLIWNQGHAGQCKAGVNRHGVRYDSCAYAEKALKKLAEVSTSAVAEVATKK